MEETDQPRLLRIAPAGSAPIRNETVGVKEGRELEAMIMRFGEALRGSQGSGSEDGY